MGETVDRLDIGDIGTAEGMYVKADRLALDARMTGARATRLLISLPEGSSFLRIKLLRERAEGDWAVKDNPVCAERKNRQVVVELSRDLNPGALVGVDSVFYQNAYLVTAVVYGLNTLRDPDSKRRS